MENASKALIIAGEMLIGLIVISIIAYLFVAMSKPAESLSSSLSQTEVDKINSYFAKFQDRQDITAQEIVSSINYAKEQNTKQPVPITVIIQGSYGYGYGTYNAANFNSFNGIQFIENNSFWSGTKQRVLYSCMVGATTSTIDYDQNTGLIKSITFIEQPKST